VKPAVGFFCGVLATLAACGAESTGVKEYRLKAAFLYNFTKFVEWPAPRFAETNSPIVIGVWGKDPFGPDLQQVIKDRSVNGRALVFKPVETAEEAKAVHLLFIPATEDSRVSGHLRALQGSSVLTVGETEAFGEAGGIIQFLREGDKVRFNINIGSAEQAQMKISAQLQKLAKTVRRNP
jgi:hypothetical protein